MPQLHKKFGFLLLGGVFLIVIVFIVSIPYMQQLNKLFVDQLHGHLPTRRDIVIVGIDDKSLQSIGAWPWSREVFARVMDKLIGAKAKVIGVDILFLETRAGDEQFTRTLSKSSVPIVLGSKLEEGTIVKSLFTGPNIYSGYVNFAADSDGKVRSALLTTQVQGNCEVSFGYQIGAIFNPQLPYRGCDEKILPPSRLFNYADAPFTTISLSDVLDPTFDGRAVENKVVLIGSVAQDLRSNIQDVVTDIFGNSVPGVTMHAQVINSLLLNRFQSELPPPTQTLLLLGSGVVMLTLFRLIKRNLIDILLLIIVVIVSNFIGILLFDMGINWPFVPLTILLLATYIFTLAYKFAVESRQKRFIQKAFSRYINSALLKQLVENPEDLKLGGEKKVMTVMFSDVRGFTTLSEKISPEALVQLLNAYLEDMCKIVLKNNGTIDKFIGDAIMAFWNAPLENTTHRMQAVKTAIEMEKQLAIFNHTNNQTLDIGVGMHTGEMVVGNIGSSDRFDYTVLGDNVNLASRIEGLTKKYGVKLIVTQSVLEDLPQQEQIIFRQLDEVIVKGKSNAVKMYQPMENTPENAALKDAYEKAFALYQSGDFTAAAKIWEKLTDKTSHIMCERLEELKGHKDWKGVWEWKEK